MKAKKNLIAVGDRVLIDPDERTDRTTSGPVSSAYGQGEREGHQAATL